MGVWRERAGFRRLFVGDAISMIGDWLTYVAVGLLALRGPQGIVGVALVQLAHTLPQTLAAPLAGWLVDRIDRRRVLVVASLARGVVTLAMAVAAARGEIGWVQGLLFVRMAGAAFVSAASRAALPRLVARAEIAQANRILASSWAALFTAGVALGGVVTGVFGAEVALLLDALTFGVAALWFARLPPIAPERARRAAGSLLRDARANPSRLRAALAKTPMMLANGAAWVVMHAVVGAGAHAALGLGGLHAARGVGNGLGPWTLRRLGEGRMCALGAALVVAGGALLLLEAPLARVLGALVWGLGVGSAWVGGTVLLQRQAPDATLGRYAALDTGASGVASALGGLAAASLCVWASPAWAIGVVGGAALLWLAALRPRTSVLALVVLLAAGAAHADVDEALEARAVTDERFVARTLFSWTSRAQADALRAGGPLLVSGAGDGAVRSPYQRALDRVGRTEGPDAALARALGRRPRRYAWTTPYGTVIPRGARSYGPALIRVELAPTWTARFAPEENPPWRVVDARGAPVPRARAAAHPERVGVVFHVRRRARLGAYREYVICGAVERFELGARDRIREDARLLRRLRVRDSRASMWRSWTRLGPDRRARFEATLPFDTARHRPTRASLVAMRRALLRALRE